jgi:hypothetical protein
MKVAMIKASLLITLLLSIGFSIVSYADKINIKGVDRVKLLQALYKRAKVQGMGALKYDTADLSKEEATSLLDRGIDYLHGKVLKIKIPREGNGDEIETSYYDRDNGPNAVEFVVMGLSIRGEVSDGVRTGPAQPDPEMLKLKNGDSLPIALFVASWGKILQLTSSEDYEDLLTLYELDQKSRNPDHRIYGDHFNKLKSLGLLDYRGQVPPFIASLVLSSVEGEGHGIHLGLPYEETERIKRQILKFCENSLRNPHKD